MLPICQTPLLARLSAILTGLILCASLSFANAQASDQKNPQAIVEIQRLMKQGQMPQAMEKVDILIATRPTEAQGRFLKGLILTEMGRQNEAITLFTKLTEDFPELPEPYNNLAVLYAQQKKYERAKASLEMAIRTHPSYSIAHENLGDVYARLASQAYDKALQVDSSNSFAQTKLAMIKDLISVSSKPEAKSSSAIRAESEAAKVVVADQSKPALVKTTEKPLETITKPLETITKPLETKAQLAPVTEVKSTPVNTPPVMGPIEVEVAKVLQGWAQAWSNKEVKTYLNFYASNFKTPNGKTRQAWEAERAGRIDKPGKLKIDVSDVKVTVVGNKATVRFRQNYASATLKSSINKMIIFERNGSKWLIEQERVD